MKTLQMLLIACAFTTIVHAQTTKTPLGGYGAGTAEITWLNGKPSLALGAYGGILINHKWLIGVSGNNIFFDHTVNGKEEDFQLNYYGLYSEYRINPERRLSMSVGLTGAMGWQENSIASGKDNMKRDGDYTYVIQPKVGLNLKIVSFMQVQAYGAYRFTGNTNSQYYTKSNYNGVTGGIGLVFGAF